MSRRALLGLLAGLVVAAARVVAVPVVAGGSTSPAPAPPAKAAAGPRIDVEPEGFNFGKTLQKRTLAKQFRIRNHGTADLVIEGITSGCNCIAEALESRVILPGGSTSLTVKLLTQGSLGRLKRSILVKSNDTARSPLEIVVEADVTAEK